MSTALEPIPQEEFCAALGHAEGPLIVRLYEHFSLLCRWGSRHSLVGGAVSAAWVRRHYGESLAAMPLLQGADGVLVDVGSGAGFPGFVLAAAKPELAVHLVEPRHKRAAFLESASRRCEVEVRVVWDRIERRLPEELPSRIDFVTLRALSLSVRAWELLLPRLAPRARVLVWSGAEEPAWTRDLEQEGVVVLPDSHSRRIIAYRAKEGPHLRRRV